jgi:voltage-dependent potassium channel beta subunit
MNTRQLGSSGLRVSEVGIGSWLTFGSRVDESGTANLVRRAFDLGINFFDTADVYAGGEAEEALGRGLRSIPRPHLVIATKCFFPMSENPNAHGLSRKHVVESVEASLRRLGTDYLDLHQCHRQDTETPLQETVRAYEDLIRQGKVLYWGVSEWSAASIEDACRIADATGGYRPISNQPNYSIMRRGIESEILPTCARLGVGQVAFSPLGQGVLTGKYSGGQRPATSRAADPERNLWMNDYLTPSALACVDRLRPLAAKLDISMAQLALTWCLQQRGLSSVLVGATSTAQLEENIGAAGLVLDDEILAEIDLIFPAP